MALPDIKHPIPADIDFKAWILSMPIVTVDLETYYDDEVGFKKMTTYEYVQHPLFKVQGMAIRIDNVVNGELVRGETIYYRDPEDGMAVLRGLDKWVLVAQNTKFEGYVKHLHYDVHPTVYADTKSMSKGLWPFESSSLKNLAERLWPDNDQMRKGDELALSKGVREWDDHLHQQVGEVYCRQDVFLTAEAFWEMFNDYPSTELEIIHITCRMAAYPTMVADHALLEEARDDDIAERKKVGETALKMIQVELEEQGIEYWNPHPASAKKRLPLDTKLFSGRDRFIALLRDIYKMELPMKQKERRDGSKYETPALAKNDPEYIALKEMYPDLLWLFNARETFASSQSLSRARRMIAITPDKYGNEMPVPLGYYNAHTGRYGGEEKINMQNLGRGSKHRLAMYAPEGFMCHVADSSNVEARTNAGFAGQEELLEAFRNKRDVYSEFAADAFNMPVNKKDNPFERSAGKVCVGADTLILTDKGIKPIVYLDLNDKIWDGIEWVSHEGVVCNGVQKTVTAFGLEATSDHEILAGDSWVEWQQVLTNPSLMMKAISAAHLPLWAGKTQSKTENPLDGTLSSSAIAGGEERCIEAISQAGVPLAVMSALKKLQAKKGTSNTNQRWKTTTIEQDYSTGCPQPFPDATTPKTKCTNTMGCGESPSVKSGETTGLLSLNMFRLLKDGTIRFSKWTEQTLTEVMYPEISDSSLKSKMSETSEKSRTSKNALGSLSQSSQVYDVVNAGPRNRFTVITELGPLIVHNCVLGLGYQMGAPTLRRTFASGPMGMDPIIFPMETVKKMVDTYRAKNYMIAQSWKTAQQMIELMCVLEEGETREWGCLTVLKNRIRLPNGMYLNYPGLHYNAHYESMVYHNGKFWKRLYGGALIENIIQALARIIVMDQCVRIDRYLQSIGGWITMQVHDENIGIAPDFGEERNNEVFNEINQLMCISPDWMSELPLDSEGGWARNYSK